MFNNGYDEEDEEGQEVALTWAAVAAVTAVVVVIVIGGFVCSNCFVFKKSREFCASKNGTKGLCDLVNVLLVSDCCFSRNFICIFSKYKCVVVHMCLFNIRCL